MSKIQRQLKADQRLFGQLARAAIKGDIVRALVELVTNADDSYRRLARSGRFASGSIHTRVGDRPLLSESFLNEGAGAFALDTMRLRGVTYLEVVDQGEGMDAADMDRRVGHYAADTSGFTAGVEVRGLFGRGLKDAILGLGDGKICAVKDGRVFFCRLSQDGQFETETEGRKLTSGIKKRLSDVGIDGGGTLVRIKITNPDVRIPKAETLLGQLENWYSLRDILSSDKRNVELEISTGKTVTRRTLCYRSPRVEKVLIEKDLTLAGYPDVKVRLTAFKSVVALDQDGPCRQGGLLIASKVAVHDLTLLRFDTEIYAAKIFGRAQCDHLDTLIQKGEPVISDKRDGVDWNHPFCQVLKRVLEDELGVLVEQIRKEEEGLRRQIENERTRKRFQETVNRPNQIFHAELKAEGGEKIPAVPPNGLDFIPEYYQVLAGRPSVLSLKALIPWPIKPGSHLVVRSDSPDIEVETPNLMIPPDASNGTLTINPRLVGRSVGSEAFVTATCGERSAVAHISVVATRKPPDRHEPRGKSLIAGIRFDPGLPESHRFYFDRSTGVISIGTKAPSVAKYLGLAGEGQESRECQVLVAELVVAAVAEELAERRLEKGLVAVLEDRAGAMAKERNRLVLQYGRLIHDVMVG